MAGRPKSSFSDEEVGRITEYALNNCHFDTIAMALDIPLTSLKRHFGRFITQKRAEGRVMLRANQVKLSHNHPAMAIFLGKNELGQTDKVEKTDIDTNLPEMTAERRAEILAISVELRRRDLTKAAEAACKPIKDEKAG